MAMRGTWRAFGLGALVMFVVLGTGWVLERATGGVRSQGGAAVGEPVKPGDAVQPAATDQESDRSDLLLVQG